MRKLILNLWSWLVLWLWTKPVQKPEHTPPLKIKAVEVAHAYMVVQYHGQRVNMLKDEYPFWKAMNRKDKRAMANKFAKMEKEGKIRFEEVEGKVIAIKNKSYGDEKMSK
jgi:hypothetical protein